MRLFIEQYWRLFVVIASVLIVVTASILVMQPVRYDASFAVTVAREPSSDTPASHVYYTLQAARSVTDMVQQWLAMPATVISIAETAQMSSPLHRLRDADGFFDVRRRGAQLIEARATVVDVEQAEALRNAIAAVLQEQINGLGLSNAQGRFVIRVANPVVVDGRLPVVSSSLFVAGVGVAIVALWQLADPALGRYDSDSRDARHL